MSLNRQISEEKRCEMGDRLRSMREKLNFTQERMADILEISKAHYGLVERGNNCLSLSKYQIVPKIKCF